MSAALKQKHLLGTATREAVKLDALVLPPAQRGYEWVGLVTHVEGRMAVGDDWMRRNFDRHTATIEFVQRPIPRRRKS